MTTHTTVNAPGGSRHPTCARCKRHLSTIDEHHMSTCSCGTRHFVPLAQRAFLAPQVEMFGPAGRR